MMTEEAAKAMNEMTVYEVRLLHDLHGLNAITGNGHVTAVVEEDKVEYAERARVEHGY